ncbi:MAG: DUF2326 domain-containing protein [Gemmatimonadota bacterium]|nr:DUF2326 domain-containing protein [Gemmatimonadota bacterium]MDE2873300.1 DUF2326 domain-containing protein [Gemmatimonadota bacterium]
MIHSITANQPSFRGVELTSGLNVILADRAEESSRKDTRNGLGKSTLIEIIHFCLGARVRRDRGLAIPALEDWAFTMQMSLRGERIAITRAVASPNAVAVRGLGDEWPDLPSADLMEERSFTQAQWRAFLGRALFSLPSPDAPKYNPSFRSLISYFVRRGHDAFGDPFTHHRRQPIWDMQLHVALLLGLEWRHAAQWQAIRDRDKDLKSLRKLVDRDAVPHLGGSVGELEAERITLAQEIEDSSQALDSFRVHPEYESIRHEANQLTEELHRDANANVAASRRLDLYRQAIESEEPPSADSINDVYEEMGVVFSQQVRRSLAQAREFYGLVIRDRRRFLQKEISRLEQKIAETDRRIRGLTESRARLMEILTTHGALEEMVKLQERHVARSQELERVKDQIERRRQMESDERRVARERADLADLAAQDHDERRKLWNDPVRLFNLNSQALYRAPGRLVIDTTDSGLKFNIEITKSGSDGIDKMKIFCLDLALLEFSTRRGLLIDFLAHDSEMYDSVDSRQRAAAIQRAREVADATGTQYICALNSDMVPYDDFHEGFRFDEHVRLRLTDGDPAGTLLGMVFDPAAGG